MFLLIKPILVVGAFMNSQTSSHGHELPVVGTWYWDVEHSIQFEIVATDEGESLNLASIEIQYFDGELEEIDSSTWFTMKVVSIAAPKDWSGPFEIDKDQFPELYEDFHPYTPWINPIDNLDNLDNE
jgi:hypothetical protein